MPSELMKHCFAGVICWKISAAVNVRTCSVKLAKWCDAATKAWPKIERNRDSISYPYHMLGAFHPHLQLKLKNNAGDVFPAGHYAPASQWGSNLAGQTLNIFTVFA